MLLHKSFFPICFLREFLNLQPLCIPFLFGAGKKILFPIHFIGISIVPKTLLCHSEIMPVKEIWSYLILFHLCKDESHQSPFLKCSIVPVLPCCLFDTQLNDTMFSSLISRWSPWNFILLVFKLDQGQKSHRIR